MSKNTCEIKYKVVNSDGSFTLSDVTDNTDLIEFAQTMLTEYEGAKGIKALVLYKPDINYTGGYVQSESKSGIATTYVGDEEVGELVLGYNIKTKLSEGDLSKKLDEAIEMFVTGINLEIGNAIKEVINERKLQHLQMYLEAIKFQ